MKNFLFTLIIVFLSYGCENKKQKENSSLNEKDKLDLKNKPIENNLFGAIDTYQEINLYQTNNKCGEWGGDVETIRVYKTELDQQILVDYTEKTIDCEDPYSDKSEPNIRFRNGIAITQADKKLIQDCITELINYKLTAKQIISHSGIGNMVITKDSTLIIKDWPSFVWPKFRELSKTLREK